jgi:hypothetical protein
VPRGGQRLHLIDTLRAAAPWQRLRRDQARPGAPPILVRPDDFHLRRHEQKRSTTTIFALDASGSSALYRLAEAKGAVELLLRTGPRARLRGAAGRRPDEQAGSGTGRGTRAAVEHGAGGGTDHRPGGRSAGHGLVGGLRGRGAGQERVHVGTCYRRFTAKQRRRDRHLVKRTLREFTLCRGLLHIKINHIANGRPCALHSCVTSKRICGHKTRA